MNVAVFGRKLTKQNVEYFQEIFKILETHGWKPIVESNLRELLIKKAGIGEDFEEFQSHKDFQSGIDLSLSIGGDGTFIQNVKFIRDSGVPVLGINMGRLGFLANIPKDRVEESLDLIKQKKYVHQQRSLIRVETEANHFGEDNFALNELAIQKKDSSSMITVHASLENKYLNSYWADGLIVSTPTGSTGYSLSCGGPIITPGCQVHILTPIAPHNLNVRPMVVPDHMPVKLSIEGRNRTCLMSLDGKSVSMRQNEEVTIHKANYMINVIKFEDNNFLDTIRNKMLWGLDRRN
jgi:NAD+ kinase